MALSAVNENNAELKSLSKSPSDDSGVDEVASANANANNGDTTGGFFFKFFLGDATGYGQMTKGDKLALFKNELILGFIIAFAQIPESVAFAFLARLEPSIAIHSAWVMGLICALFGGRPAMVNGATGAFAAIIGTFLLVPESPGQSGGGVETLFVSVPLAGVFMLIAHALDLGKYVSIISYPIMLGFCNGLAIVIGRSQLHPFSYTCSGGNRRCASIVYENVSDAANMSDMCNVSAAAGDDHHHYVSGAELGCMIAIVLTSMVVMEFVPKIPFKLAKLLPSSLLAIVVAIFIEFVLVRLAGGIQTDTIGDVAPFSEDTAFPIPAFVDDSRYPGPSVPPGCNVTLGRRKYDFKNNLDGRAGQILLQAFLLAVVGLIESLLTQEVVNKFTKTKGDRGRTIVAMGSGNILSGLLGGMGGNAMIGLSTINCLNGGRGRLAPTVTALVVMVMIMGGYPVLNYVPVSALVGIMIVVVLHTFKWHSLPAILVAALPERARERFGLRYKIDRMDVLVVLIVTVATNLPFLNLAYAIFIGLAFSGLVYSWKSAQRVTVSSELVGSDLKIYRVSGPLFFGSTSGFPDFFDAERDPSTVEAHFTDAMLFDSSAMKVLNTLTKMYSSLGKTFVIRKLDPLSTRSVFKASRLLHYVELATGDDVPVKALEGDDETPQQIIGNSSTAKVVVSESAV